VFQATPLERYQHRKYMRERVADECGDNEKHGSMPSIPPPAAFPELCPRPVSGLTNWP